MNDILAQLECLEPWVSQTTLRQLSRVITGMLAMSGKVTMLGISRWAGSGGATEQYKDFSKPHCLGRQYSGYFSGII